MISCPIPIKKNPSGLTYAHHSVFLYHKKGRTLLLATTQGLIAPDGCSELGKHVCMCLFDFTLVDSFLPLFLFCLLKAKSTLFPNT